jgi:hypothetical protein
MARDSCAGDTRRVGNCRLRLPDGRIAALPIDPSEFCKDLGDEGHELVVVEMQAPPAAPEVAWLEDEAVSVVLVVGAERTTEVPRESLRAHVRQRVPLRPCTRDLRRAVYTLCRPHGSDGPVLTLVPAADALKLVAAAS